MSNKKEAIKKTLKSKKQKRTILSMEEYLSLKFFSLTNHRQMKTPFGFVDETGLLNSKADAYFGIGLIKTQRAPTIYPRFRSLRT